MEYDLRRLCSARVEVYENVDGATLTSFKSGGRVKYFMRPSDVDGLAKCIYTLVSRGEKYTVLGNGTNVLISDGGYGGAIINLSRIKTVRIKGDCLYASSGVSLPLTAQVARDNNLSGLEFAVGIPASVGGAAVMNAGAYGAEMADFITEIDVLNGDSVETLSADEFDFGYRRSNIEARRLTVLGVRLKLQRGSREEISARMRKYAELRRRTQPHAASAGSVFKKFGGESPAYYIDMLGLKGSKRGGAEVSEEHANFIVNAGGATTADYLLLAQSVADKMYEHYGVELEKEVKVLGD